MLLKRSKAATVTLLIALIMILIFGFGASAKKKGGEPVSRAPERKTHVAESSLHGSSAPASFSLHPAARYKIGAYEDIPDDFTESAQIPTFHWAAQEEIVQTDLSRYVRMADNGYASADNDLGSTSPASPANNRPTSPLVYYYNPSSPSSPNNPTVSPGPTTLPNVNPAYVSNGNPAYVSNGNPAYIPNVNSSYPPAVNPSPTPVPSTLLLLGSGVIAFSLLRTAFSVLREKTIQRSVY